MDLEFKLQVFEGPLDLLLHLIDKNKINIYDIPIVTITDQYMEYVKQMDKQDLNIVSEFLVMAATLRLYLSCLNKVSFISYIIDIPEFCMSKMFIYQTTVCCCKSNSNAHVFPPFPYKDFSIRIL